MSVSNALDYHGTELITFVKGFMIRASPSSLTRKDQDVSLNCKAFYKCNFTALKYSVFVAITDLHPSLIFARKGEAHPNAGSWAT